MTGPQVRDGMLAAGRLTMLPIHKPTKRRTCNVRLAYYPPGRHVVSGPEYAWCDEKATWTRGDQELCDFHAGVASTGKLPLGINEDGKWA